MSKNIGVIGSGTVGETLANGFLKHGHRVMRGSREPEKLAGWLAEAGPNAETGTFAATAAFGDIVVLAVKGSAASAAIAACGTDALAQKIVLDATNPIADAPPENGVLRFFTTHDESLMERLQRAAPQARFVKAFSSVGAGLMVDPELPGGRPTMFIAGNDNDAKAETRAILDAFGWDTADMGTATAARAIEPLCMLWCIPGFLHGRWNHAFKLIEG
ncbi:MAG: NAD(P)-binding domain-containing protein [Planctomycetes bacterium]|nr:NAD(P)-binding domain-containing protein [Planctomycetota bacterium]